MEESLTPPYRSDLSVRFINSHRRRDMVLLGAQNDGRGDLVLAQQVPDRALLDLEPRNGHDDIRRGVCSFLGLAG